MVTTHNRRFHDRSTHKRQVLLHAPERDTVDFWLIYLRDRDTKRKSLGGIGGHLRHKHSSCAPGCSVLDGRAP